MDTKTRRMYDSVVPIPVSERWKPIDPKNR
jgi:hypothetical protein